MVNVAEAAVADVEWQRDARRARGLAWVSLVWMSLEASVGLAAGLRANSIALVGWALGSAVEALAATVIVWRFSRRQQHRENVERHAQLLVAASFWLLAPYIAVEAVQHLRHHDHPTASGVGLALTALAVLVMPVLGHAKRRLGERLGSAATSGEGSQNYLCALQAAAVLAGLAVTALTASTWWLDSVIALALAAWALWEGRKAWQGNDCC